MTVGVGGQYHLGATLEGLGADVVGVAHDELRAVSGLAQHVRAAADTDEDRLILLDERLERAQVVFGVGLVGDDHHMAAAQVDVDVGDADPVDE